MKPVGLFIPFFMVSGTPILPPLWDHRLFWHTATYLPLLLFPNNNPIQPPVPPCFKGYGPAQDWTREDSRAFSSYCSWCVMVTVDVLPTYLDLSPKTMSHCSGLWGSPSLSSRQNRLESAMLQQCWGDNQSTASFWYVTYVAVKQDVEIYHLMCSSGSTMQCCLLPYQWVLKWKCQSSTLYQP